MSESNPMFKGTELSRLLLLLAIAVVGWVLAWKYWMHTNNALAEAEAEAAVVVEDEAPEPITPDASPAFETVTDRSPVGFRDSAAYDLLLKRVHETGANELATAARRDVTFGHLVLHPKDYRGVPVHLLGTAYMIVREPSKKGKDGWLYTAYVVTSDSGHNPAACVFDDPPKGLPIGTELNERVVFNGYFLKMMQYSARNGKERFAPLLVGRLGWTPPPEGVGPAKKPEPNRGLRWMLVALGVMIALSLFRWLAGLRRTLASRGASTYVYNRPTEEIAPEELASFLENLPAEEEAPPEGR